LKRELEALLFATDGPLTLGRLKKIFAEAEAAEIKAAVAELRAEYEDGGNAFDIVEFGGGWQIATRPEYSPVVEQLLRTRRTTRLSKAGLEVLAIIAYRQPITRLEIDEIRGVNSSGAISTLTERNLITVVGRSQTVGNPLLYGTTREFLNHLGLKGLTQLPDLPDLEVVMEDRAELKEFASRVGREVSDEELEEYFSAPETRDEDGDEGEETAGIPAPTARLAAGREATSGDAGTGEAAPPRDPAADEEDPARPAEPGAPPEESADHGQA